MKLLLVFTFFALACVARSAPPSLLKFADSDEIEYQPIEEENSTIAFGADDEIEYQPIEKENSTLEIDADDEMVLTTTTTTTTTRRSTYVFPTRDRNTIPSRRPWTQSTTSVETATTVSVDETDNDMEGGFKYFKRIRKFFQKLMKDFKNFIRKLTGFGSKKVIPDFNIEDNDD